MHKIKLFFSVIILSIISHTTLAQNTTNSPYTRYGYGNLADKAFAAQRGMGGIGYGVRNPKIINSMNPASYSNVDSMTFMLDMGLMGDVSWLEEGNSRERLTNGGLEYIAMQFPLSKNMGFGAGLEPISHVGYRYGDHTTLNNDDNYANFIYQGSGGLSQVYGSLSYNILNRLAVGAKVAYLFGDIKHNRTSSFSSSENYTTAWIDTLRIYGLTYDIGVQYQHPFSKSKNMVVGLVYTPKLKVNGIKKTETVRYSGSSTMSSDYIVYRDSVFEMPESLGAGITLNQINKYSVGFDVLFQKWEDVKFQDKDKEFFNLLKYNAGGEFIPDILSRNYLKQIRYRAGAYYSDSYFKLKDTGYKEYGLSVGVGLPTVDRRSMINMSLEYSMLRPNNEDLINEQSFRITLSYTFNELWFFKRKVQ